ncbi:MAG: DNA methyltransferase [Anaerolineae bacterium]
MTVVTNLQQGLVEQLRLFEAEAEESIIPLESNGSTFHDPAFSGNKSLPIHRWVPWIAGFSSHFVEDVLDRYLDDKGTVLDPFAGVGTTLVAAVLQGHDAVGFEINHYAVLACRAKVGSPPLKCC